MPLRDHFHSPVEDKHAWSELHSMWPAMMVRYLYNFLPKGFVSAPGVHLGKEFEIDISVMEDSNRNLPESLQTQNGGVATIAPPMPTLTLETELPDQDEFEVRIYDARHGRRLVAAIEIVSPFNKDRPESRAAFVTKVAALLNQEVCVSIIDLVTIPKSNLYCELLKLVNAADPNVKSESLSLYSVTIRNRKGKRSFLDMWYYPMKIGEVLPEIPIWLEPEMRVILPLEPSYQETCQLLHIA